MKKIIYLAICAMCIVSCGNGGSIAPTSKKINGPLGKFFEVVERDYKLDDGKIRIEFKRIADGGPQGSSWSSGPKFSVELLDDDGNSISSESSDLVTAKEQLETVFALGVDETASIAFSFDNPKKATKFKVSSKWDEGNAGNGKDIAIPSPSKAAHQVAVINDPDGYTNVRAKPNVKANIVAKIVDGERFFFDVVPGSNWVKVYRTADAPQYIGYMHNSRVKPIDGGLSSLNGDNPSYDDEIDTGLAYDDEGDISYDELIDEYERFYRTYIRFLKKMDKDNPTAMIEYAKLFKQYNDYCAKLEKAKGHLSSNQLSRINKMNIELMEEIQKIQKQ